MKQIVVNYRLQIFSQGQTGPVNQLQGHMELSYIKTLSLPLLLTQRVSTGNSAMQISCMICMFFKLIWQQHALYSNLN